VSWYVTYTPTGPTYLQSEETVQVIKNSKDLNECCDYTVKEMMTIFKGYPAPFFTELPPNSGPADYCLTLKLRPSLACS
jgi:hypothetical protein